MGYLHSIKGPEDIKELGPEALDALAEEIRDALIRVVERNGGHLASNLGVVELTMALLRVYSPPEDVLLFDVGHQAYVYKLLTGRTERFETIRTAGGLSGFPHPEESEYDAFITGHSSTAPSVGLGIARAKRLQGKAGHVVCVIGDGALTGGMAFEALNDIGQSQMNMTIVLNDNNMSINRNVGALSRHLAKLRASNRYVNTKIAVRDKLLRWPVLGKGIKRAMDGTKRLMRGLLVPNRLFDAMGLHYLGPFDGHDRAELEKILESSKDLGRPVLLHVVTKKGKGYEKAERHPAKYHGVAPYFVEKAHPLVSMSAAFGDKLTEMATQREDIVAIKAPNTEVTGLSRFSEAYPRRFFDVAIAEQHAAAMAGGMASQGLRPFLCLYSTFMQRAYDQILHDICLGDLPVTIMVDRAGFVGEDGVTHQGLYDIGFLRNLPNMRILAPSSAWELRRMMEYAYAQRGPVAIRYAKDGEEGEDPGEVAALRWALEGRGDVALIASGRMLRNAREAATALGRGGVAARVVSARCLWPMDHEALGTLAKECKLLVVIEEHVPENGLASAMAEYFMAEAKPPRLLSIAAKRSAMAHADVETQWELSGLLPEQIVAAVESAI